MTVRERFLAVLNFCKPTSYPMYEWASWWDKTLNRWYGEGLSKDAGGGDLFSYFGLDSHTQYWIEHKGDEFRWPNVHGAGVIKDEQDYEKLLPILFPDNTISRIKESIQKTYAAQQRGDTVVWLTLEGFFWFPRVLFGIEGHLFSFYDYPELYHRICEDLLQFHFKVIDEFCEICVPDFMTIAEDMSYNKGPMLSEQTFDEFIAPYYRRLIPKLKEKNIKVFVDTDGDVTPMLPWLLSTGVEGIGPLERQAGVDILEIRKKYPKLLMFGGYDKMVMSRGEQAMRNEFERLHPALLAGGFLQTVDHQTPPEVSFENYKTYINLYREYTRA